MNARPRFVAGAVVLLAALLATLWLAPRFVPGLRRPARRAVEALPSLAGEASWVNAAPLPPDSLRGRPTAMLLWSDTDPRGLAALAVADAWHRAFAPYGVRVLAVHEPTFEFAADSAVAGRLARRLRLAVPVVHDGSCFVEGALGGAADGPRLLVADEAGRVVVDTLADLVAGEDALRAILRRTRPDAMLPPSPEAALPEGVRTVELGAGRVEGGPLKTLSAGHEAVFTAEFGYQEHGRPFTPYPVGGWRTGAEGLTATRGGAANFVAIRYSAGRAGVVVTPPPGRTARLWILRDDRWPRAEECGDDAARDGRGAVSVTVAEPRLYWIDRGEGERVLKISPESPGVTVNAFVFTGAR